MSEAIRQPVYLFEGFRLDAQRRVLYAADGRPIPLTPRLFDTLIYFVERAGQLLTKEELLAALWPNVVVEEHNLNKIVSELRRVLGEKPGEHRFILTKSGRGYRFVANAAIEPRAAAEIELVQRDSTVDGTPVSSAPLVPANGALPSASRRRHFLWVTATLVAAAVAGGIALWSARPSAPPPGNPLAGARFTRFTNFPGDETSAAISPDGKFVLFVADRDGRPDVWLGQVDTQEFRNLTGGTLAAGNRSGREGGFTGDGSQIWLGGGTIGRRLSVLPLMGGAQRPFLADNIANLDWSPDGTRIVYHTNEPGDPIYLADRDGANARQLHRDEAGVHNHFPTWSKDGEWIYFVRFRLAGADLWRVAAAGGPPENLVNGRTYIGFPAPLDERTLLFVAEDSEGGPWLWTLDVETKVTSRVSFGLERYTSIAASANGRRLVAAVASPVANLWSVPVLDRQAGESDVRPYPVPSDRALAPRFSATALYYLSSRGGGDGLWRVENGETVEVWRDSEDALRDPPAISADGDRIAVVVSRGGRQRLTLIKADGSESHVLAEAIDIRGAPSWSPDGQWLAVSGIDADGDGLFKVPVEGGAPIRLADSGLNPAWSPNGDLIFYIGSDVGGGYAQLSAVTPAGDPVDMPVIMIRSFVGHFRFLPDGSGLVYMKGGLDGQDFSLLDLTTKQSRQLTQLSRTDTMRTFDITPDGREIVFDRQRQNSDIVLIDLPRE